MVRKICAAPGCQAIAVTGKARCAAHDRAASDRRKVHDQARNRDPARKLYKSRKWINASRSFRARYPWCATNGCGQPSELVDHRTPHKGDPGLFWDRGNWQALCWSCHSSKTAAEDGGFGNRGTGGGVKNMRSLL